MVSEPEGKRQQYENRRFEPKEMFGVNFVRKTVWLEELKLRFKDCQFQRKTEIIQKSRLLA